MSPDPEPMSPDPELTGAKAQIAQEIVRIHEENYGQSASNVKVYLLDDSVLVTLDVSLAQSERTLVTAGRGDAVRETRQAFQQAIAPTFVAVVERATGRRVISFFSFTSVEEPVYSCEFFRLEHDLGPQPEEPSS